MPRLLFEKTGSAIWISHLDLMRLFQRAFKRAGLPLTHTQGFNPRPSVSIALPLSVGVQSHCELLDFDLDGEAVPYDELCSRLNNALIDGINVLCAYDTGKKIRDLAFLDCQVTLQYDDGVPEGALEQMSSLFSQPELMVTKKTKNGIQEQNIVSMIRSISMLRKCEKTIRLDARICCQNPTLNPAQLCAAIERYLPEMQPDFSSCCRIEIYDLQENVFR